MKITTRLDIIKFDSAEVVVNDLVKLLAKLPVSDLVAYLKGPALFANRDHATILKNVMKDEVWKFKLVSRVAEKGLSHDFYSRLDFFDESPVTVLENLFLKMVKIQPELIDDYLEDMWLFAIQVVGQKDAELMRLWKLGQKSPASKIVLKDLFPAINSVFGDEPGDLDGVLLKTFAQKAINAATIKELREIAEKNEVHLPNNLTKQDIVDAIVAILPSVAKTKELPSLIEDVKDMTVADLKTFVEKYKLDVATELRKQDIGDLLVKNYVNLHTGKVAQDLQFVLPERVVKRTDEGDQNPKIVHLNEKISELEKELAKKPTVEVKEVPVVVEKVVTDETKLIAEQQKVKEEKDKVDALTLELNKVKAELANKPKEVRVEVPGPTVVRTVVNTTALQKQKEKYEALIAEQEKERSLLVNRIDEHDEILAKYAKVKKELEEEKQQAIVPLKEVESVKPAPVVEPVGNDALQNKIERLSDKIHELQLEIVRREHAPVAVASVPTKIAPSEDGRETEVNIFFGKDLASKLSGKVEESKPSKGKKAKKAKKSKGKRFLRFLFILIILALVVFMGSWMLVYFSVAPFAGPPWLADPVNGALNTLYGLTEGVFVWFKSLWASITSLFS